MQESAINSPLATLRKTAMALLAMLVGLALCAGYSAANPQEAYAASKTPAKVKSVKVTKTTTSSIKIAWNKAKNTKKYQVAYKKKTAKKWTYKSTKSRSYCAKSLPQNTRYQFKVRAINGKKKGKWSSVKKTYTSAKSPGKVTGIKVTATNRTLTFSWDKVKYATGYIVSYAEGDKTYSRWYSGFKEKDTDKTTLTLKNLDKDTTYTYHICAYNEGPDYASGKWSKLKTATTTMIPAANEPMPSNNLSSGGKRNSALVDTGSNYMRVFYDDDSEKAHIEYYDYGFKLLSRSSLALELPIWGGFFNGADNYYLVEGKNNTAEDDAAEVIRVIKYDKSWNRVGAVSITSQGGVGYPFIRGNVEMTEQDGKLYVVTARRGYVDESVGQGHQGFYMVAVDEESMKGDSAAGDLSHSFAQYVVGDGANLYVAEQCEGLRRAQLTKFTPATESFECYREAIVELYKYGGERTSSWAIPCYATVNGAALSSQNILTIGTSIDQTKYDSYEYDSPYNLYVTVTPTSSFTEDDTKVIQLTNYTSGDKEFKGAEITKINDDRFMVSWQENEIQDEQEDDELSLYRLHYVFIDGSGNKIGQEHTAEAAISNCKPIVSNGKIVYYASDDVMMNFYTIDAETGKFEKSVFNLRTS